jgi:hypothetical protein
MGFTVAGGRITAIDALVDPERLAQVELDPPRRVVRALAPAHIAPARAYSHAKMEVSRRRSERT